MSTGRCDTDESWGGPGIDVQRSGVIMIGSDGAGR